MDKGPQPLDWSQLRVFLAVAEAGSLSGAARRLAMSQPTVGRHIQAIEAALGVALFDRHAKGLRPTACAGRLLPHARQMRESAERLALIAAGQSGDLAGTVRLTASVFVAHHILPPILADLRRDQPGIAIELVASDASDNLLFREADIALRMYRPTQPELCALRLGEVRFGAFAAPAYLDRRGRPARVGDLAGHDLIGFDRDDRIIRAMRAGGLAVTRDSFATRTDHPTVYWALLRAGCGIGFGQIGAARHDPAVERVLPGLPIAPLPIWLAAPMATRRHPRIARVWAHLETGLRRSLRAAGTP